MKLFLLLTTLFCSLSHAHPRIYYSLTIYAGETPVQALIRTQRENSRNNAPFPFNQTLRHPYKIINYAALIAKVSNPTLPSNYTKTIML